MRSLEIVDEHYQQALKAWLCAACKSPRPGTGAIDVMVEEHGTRSKAALNFVQGAGVPVAKRDFLFSLGTERIERDLYVGKVLDRDGSPLRDLVTFRGKREVTVRGVKNVAFRHCPECGRLLYFAMIGNRYLHPRPPEDTELFESQFGGLVFPRSIAKGLDFRSWPLVTREILPVREMARDGRGNLEAIYPQEGDLG